MLVNLFPHLVFIIFQQSVVVLIQNLFCFVARQAIQNRLRSNRQIFLYTKFYSKIGV